MAYNLDLRARIFLGFLLPLGLLLGVSIAVYWNVRTVQRLSASLELGHDISRIADAAAGYVQLMQSSSRGYLLSKNDRARKNYDRAAADYRNSIAALSRQIADPQQRETLRKISVVSERLGEVTKKYIELVDHAGAPGAIELFRTGTGIELGGQLDELTDQFAKRQAEILQASASEQGEALSRLLVVVLGATALAVVLAVVAGLWIASRIRRTISEAVAGMSSSSTQIAATVDEHERTVTQQAAAVNETTSTIEELEASSRQSAEQAAATAEAAKQALESTRDGVRLANQVAESMEAMKGKVGSVAEQILRLSEQAGRIGGIAKVVGELAGETNMLALNAAVEAARAGEHGKGFAVVAIEVRKLADQSKKSAERANALVAEIQKATNSAVMVTEEGARTAEAVAAITRKTLETYGSIEAAANSMSENAQQVLLNSRQQSAALGQVTEAMKSLAAGSRQIATGTEQTKVGVRTLNSVALGLKALV